MKNTKIKRFEQYTPINENVEKNNSFFVVQHESGLFLKHQYANKDTNKSGIMLVENEFPCFVSEQSAKEYINVGDDLVYSYDDVTKKEDLKIIELKKI